MSGAGRRNAEASDAYRPLGRGERLVAWMVTDACSLLAWAYLFGLNRTTIVRPYTGGRATNLIFVSNHQSPMDAFLIGLAAWFPRTLWRPALHPWSLAAREYWFRGRARSWLARHLRCIPLDRGRPDTASLRRLCEELRGGVAVFFPEGRRSPDGRILSARPGAGYLAWRTRARIVPVALDGLLGAMPYEDPRPGLGHRFRIAFGDALDCGDLYDVARGREAAETIVRRAMAAVRRLHADLAPAPPGAPAARGRGTAGA